MEAKDDRSGAQSKRDDRRSAAQSKGAVDDGGAAQSKATAADDGAAAAAQAKAAAAADAPSAKDGAAEADEDVLMLVMETLEGMLFEEVAMSFGDSDDDDDGGAWTAARSPSAERFRERRRALEAEAVAELGQETGEYSLRLSAIHEELRAAVEDEVESALSARGVANVRFMRMLSDASAGGGWRKEASAEVQELLGEVDSFTKFVGAMEAKKGRQ